MLLVLALYRVNSFKVTGHLTRERKKLTQDFREGHLEKKLQGPAVFVHLGPQQRALPCIDEELRERFGREVLGKGASSLRLADHQRNLTGPLGKRHGLTPREQERAGHRAGGADADEP